MALAWWERTDRAAELQEARRLHPSGGLLILRGGDADGRGQMAELVAESFRALNDECLLLRSTYDVAPVRSALTRAWRLLVPDKQTVLPAPVAAGGILGYQEIARRIQQLVARRPGTTAFILEDVDLVVPVGRAERAALRSLGAAERCAVVVMSRRETDTEWEETDLVVDLGMFDADDLREALGTTPDLADLGGRQLDEMLETVLEGHPSRLVPARTAYSRLKGLVDDLRSP